jgi:hypothetical protein
MLGSQDEGLRAFAFTRGDIGHPTARCYRAILGKQRSSIIISGELIAMFYEQPIVFLVAHSAVLDSNQHPSAM